MKTIWKFELREGARETAIEMPRLAEVIDVAWGSVLCLWAIVNPKTPLETRHFHVYITGGNVPEGPALAHLGTVHSNDGGSPLVLHVFEAT